MGEIRTFLWRELLVEWRGKEMIVAMLSLSLMLAAIAAYALRSTFLPLEQRELLFGPLGWMVFLLSATVAISRIHESDVELGAIDAIRTSGAALWLMYMVRTIVTAMILWFGHGIALFAMAVLADITLDIRFVELLGISALAVLAYSQIGVLVAALSGASRMKGMLLPLVLLPLLFPLLFSATELSLKIMAGEGIALGSPWLSLLVGLVVVYSVLGLNLFEHAVKD